MPLIANIDQFFFDRCLSREEEEKIRFALKIVIVKVEIIYLTNWRISKINLYIKYENVRKYCLITDKSNRIGCYLFFNHTRCF